MPKEEHTDHILIEVKDANPKDAKFIKQVGDERRYVFEVDAKKFWGDGALDPTVARMFECGEWLWPDAPVANSSNEGHTLALGSATSRYSS